VGGNHSIYSDIYSLWLGMVPAASVGSVWNSTTAWGMEHLGDLGMFVYMKALAAHPGGDSGEAALKALTKCDQDSWCDEIRSRDATMTRETTSLRGGTMSHGWGAATVGAIVDALVGLQQTAPGYKTFTVKPRLGGLASLSVKIPTPHGALWVNATADSLGVAVPCNSRASLCLPTR
jgi:alpha-L-rhamnosidase